jgi:hypothetical protein
MSGASATDSRTGRRCSGSGSSGELGLCPPRARAAAELPERFAACSPTLSTTEDARFQRAFSHTPLRVIGATMNAAARTVIMQVLGSVAFGVMTIVNLIVLAVVLSSLFRGNK